MVVFEAYIIWRTKLQQSNIEKLPPLSQVTLSLSVPASTALLKEKAQSSRGFHVIAGKPTRPWTKPPARGIEATRQGFETW